MPQDAPTAGAAIEAPLCFIVPQDKKPEYHSAAYTGGEPELFFDVEDRAVSINNLRAAKSPATFDEHGFELLAEPTTITDFYSDDAVQSTYYKEIEDLLKRRFGASRVAIFDATRRSDGGTGATNPDGARGPAARVHVDYTSKSGPQRFKDTIGVDEGERLLASDARIIQVNVWRPIKGPVKRAPLALADASSITTDDLIPTDQIFPDRVGEIYHLAHNPAHRWFYAPDMEREEVFLIKGWDSSDPNGSHFAPHGAFQLPDQDPTAPARESIEIRTFIIID